MPKITTPAEFMKRMKEDSARVKAKFVAQIVAFVEEWLESLPNLERPLHIPPSRGSEETLAIVRDLYEQAGWIATMQVDEGTDGNRYRRSLTLKLPEGL